MSDDYFDKRKDYFRRRREKLFSEGKCVICGQPNDSGKKTCPECRERESIKQKERFSRMTPEERQAYRDKQCINMRNRRIQLKAEGKCTRCGKPNDTTGVHCSACKELDRIENHYAYMKWYKKEDENN